MVDTTPDPKGTQPVPLWTPQWFTIAFQMLKDDTGMDSSEAVALVVATMLGDYEDERERLAAENIQQQIYCLQLEREVSRLTAELAGAKKQVAGLIQLSNENAEIGARHVKNGEISLALAIEVLDKWGRTEKHVKELEAKLAECRRTSSSAGSVAEAEGASNE